MTTIIISEAKAHGLEQDVLGSTQEVLTEFHKKILDLSALGHHDKALEEALNYACTWGFVTGYKIVFDARIGVLPNGGDSHLTIFLSFMAANTVTTSTPEEGDSSTGNTQSAGNNARLVEAESAETPQHDQDSEDRGLSYAAKRWVASRILDLMLRCYGSDTFPKKVWFVEDWVGNSPPCLLLPYTLSVPDRFGRAEKVRERIIEQISISTAPASQSPEDEQ
ncbi:hypothetical protein F4801DRAFT_598807 [Xylaria longipes]|nr:hypothetical protein F4801DRAFT_598807 [Xylaria longipes]RYC62334.1 hypothetical protein CHU98_g3861 [Xylaria longipes]